MITKNLMFDGNVLHFRNINTHLMLHDVIDVSPISNGRYLGMFEGMLIALGYNKLIIHPKPNPLLTLQGFVTEDSIDFIITDHFGERFFVQGELVFDCITAIEKMTVSAYQSPKLSKEEELAISKRLVDGKVTGNQSQIMNVANHLKRGFWNLLNMPEKALDTLPSNDTYPMPTVNFSDYVRVKKEIQKEQKGFNHENGNLKIK